jgi:hypothetical protein
VDRGALRRAARAVATVAALASLLSCTGTGAATTTTGGTGPSTTAAATTTTTAATTSTTSAAQAIASGECPAVPPVAAPDPRRPVYAATAEVDPGLASVHGSLTVGFTPDLPITDVVFRLWPNSPTEAAAGIHLAAGPVTEGTTALTATAPDPTTLDVALGREVAAGQTVTLSLPYALTVGGSVHDRVSHSGDTLRLGGFLPVLAWEPGVGWDREPPTALFAEAASTPVADYDLTLHVPSGYDVLASGEPDGEGRWRASAVRDIAASIGHFAQASVTVDVPNPVAVTVGVDRSVGESPGPYLLRAADALHDYSARFAPYPWTTFTLAVTPGLAGNGIEYPTHVMQGAGTDGRTTPHEVGHQWFYGLVGDDQARDPWLDEGLASYAEFTHEGTVARMAAEPIPDSARGHAGEPMTYWETRGSIYYRGVYVQSAVAIAGLGSQFFVDCALRHYVAANAFRIARPPDLYAQLDAIFPAAAAGLAPAGLGG